MGWGDGTSRLNVQEQITHVLNSSEEVVIDRWYDNLIVLKVSELTLHLRHVNVERLFDGKTIPILNKMVNNYIGIGVDAKLAHTFHKFREAYPFLCRSRVQIPFSLKL